MKTAAMMNFEEDRSSRVDNNNHSSHLMRFHESRHRDIDRDVRDARDRYDRQRDRDDRHTKR